MSAPYQPAGLNYIVGRYLAPSKAHLPGCAYLSAREDASRTAYRVSRIKL